MGSRPAKGFIPRARSISPFFAVWAKDEQGRTFTRALEGALDPAEYEGPSGSTAANHGLPRFSHCSFAAAYPLGQVYLDDPALQRAIEWLVANQNEEGSWDEDYYTGTGFPRVFYLKYHLYRLYFPLMALARYRRLTR